MFFCIFQANWLVLFLVIYMMCRHSHVSVKAKENNKLYKIRFVFFMYSYLFFYIHLICFLFYFTEYGCEVL